MAALKVTLWNCNGLRASAESTAHKMGFFDKMFPLANFSIAVFVETHHKGEDDFPSQIIDYKVTHNILHTPTPIGHSHRGVLVLVRKDLEILSTSICIEGRLLNFKVRDILEDQIHTISAFYGPIPKDVRREDVSALFDNFFNLHSRSDNNIILGDFNFCDNVLDKGKGMDSHDVKFCRYWDNFKDRVHITDPYREKFPTTKMFSYHNNKGKSRGDRVYVSDSLVDKVSDLTYHYYPQANTHKLLTFSLSSPDERGPGYWKLNTSVLKDPPYIKLITDSINELKNFDYENPSVWWEVLLINVRSISFDYTVQKNKVKRQSKKCWTDELVKLEALPISSMTATQTTRLKTVQNHLRKLEDDEIEGYRVRTRRLPNYEQSEPDISFYAKLEKRSFKKNGIATLKDENGENVNKPCDLLRVTANFYKKLFTKDKTDASKQKALLKNIKSTFTPSQRDSLDAPITLDELEKAVKSLNDDKSPGLTGLPAEFYKVFWPLLKFRYLNFVNFAFHNGFPLSLNTSVTTLIYKDKGASDDLANYRPISLIASDLKIISKTLTNRLSPLLPFILHKSQTAVDGRRIDHTLHLIRDLIELANQEDMEAAFIFLDQEKAFDRVDHDFLYKTMETFGIGENFINWVKQINKTAVTRIKVNGFLTEPIPLLRGVRQGDHLSFYLYLLNIELLALKLRANENIVGFVVGGEKIISMHYADDATITITQNRCFKEVIKDISIFESATGAKVNYGKTKGLWVGAWKNREDTPLDIVWTNKNVFNLGLFFGNDDPAVKTFEVICPKIVKSINYWKPFQLSILSKAKVIEIFHASRLWYAAKFYCVPSDQVKILQTAFLNYINFPRKTTTVCQTELQKLKTDGGIKLVNIQTKSEASKIQWLVSLCTNPELSLHKALMERLLGVQRGGIQGIDLCFTTLPFARRIMKISSTFYQEAIIAINKLDIKKQIVDRYEENVFYNKTFLMENEQVLVPNKTCTDNCFFKYGQFILELGAKNRKEKYLRGVTNVYDKIRIKDFQGRDDFLLITTGASLPFAKVTQKIIHEELLKKGTYFDHHSTDKWVTKLNLPLLWNKIWSNVHNPLSRDSTKSAVWGQIHLNSFTTASYNEWFKKNDPCPLCRGQIADEFHLSLECPTTKSLWSLLEPFLKTIHSSSVTPEEMAFGVTGTSHSIILRNWLGFLLREYIMKYENIAYNNKLGDANSIKLQHTFNARVKREVCEAHQLFSHNNRLNLFVRSYNPEKLFLVDTNKGVTLDNIVNVFNPS